MHYIVMNNSSKKDLTQHGIIYYLVSKPLWAKILEIDNIVSMIICKIGEDGMGSKTPKKGVNSFLLAPKVLTNIFKQWPFSI